MLAAVPLPPPQTALDWLLYVEHWPHSSCDDSRENISEDSMGSGEQAAA